MVDGEITELGVTTKADAFRRLATEHLDESYRLARAILGNPTEAEDATHDAFVRAWRKWPSLRDPGSFDAWFGRILVNTCRDRLRTTARRRSQDLSQELAGAGPNPYRQADDREQIARALADLSADHQIVIVLRYYLDLSTRQIADRLRTREGTVSSRLHYALHDLRQRLDQHVPEEQRNA